MSSRRSILRNIRLGNRDSLCRGFRKGPNHSAGPRERVMNGRHLHTKMASGILLQTIAGLWMGWDGPGSL
ncbi:hypothetical protein KQX54_015483 [Cotesia glomerata]|uniref:Uncharacterized protein n=1 Tax=Cotesia glomerata TaxID=32391 RepID=A0AAV7IHS4_COTGL|nr:hypothetical protein KQX54_015483 [Cotesia glomerata]